MLSRFVRYLIYSLLMRVIGRTLWRILRTSALIWLLAPLVQGAVNAESRDGETTCGWDNRPRVSVSPHLEPDARQAAIAHEESHASDLDGFGGCWPRMIATASVPPLLLDTEIRAYCAGAMVWSIHGESESEARQSALFALEEYPWIRWWYDEAEREKRFDELCPWLTMPG